MLPPPGSQRSSRSGRCSLAVPGCTWGCQFWCRCCSCDYCDDPVNERQRVGRWEVTARESMGYICTGGEGNGVNMRGLGLLDPGVAEVECRTPP